jgi:hypothetical protein
MHSALSCVSVLCREIKGFGTYYGGRICRMSILPLWRFHTMLISKIWCGECQIVTNTGLGLGVAPAPAPAPAPAFGPQDNGMPLMLGPVRRGRKGRPIAKLLSSRLEIISNLSQHRKLFALINRLSWNDM